MKAKLWITPAKPSSIFLRSGREESKGWVVPKQRLRLLRKHAAKGFTLEAAVLFEPSKPLYTTYFQPTDYVEENGTIKVAVRPDGIKVEVDPYFLRLTLSYQDARTQKQARTNSLASITVQEE